jgi:hypothetical protein
MSLRALRTFDSKMRKHEASLSVDLQATLPVIPVPARPMITPKVEAVFQDLQDEWEWIGDLFLAKAMGEGARLLERDLAGIEASGISTNRVTYRPTEIGQAVMADWRDSLAGLIARSLEETKRQGLLAWTYDTPPREGWHERVNSPTPVRVIGRRGMGVVPVLPSIIQGRLTNMAFGMVNGFRIDAVKQI